jgi:hypothetical protein
MTMTKAAKKPSKAAPVERGRWVRIMTADERSADIKEFGKEIRKSKESAIAFLQSAGILDDKGELAEPYRS